MNAPFEQVTSRTKSLSKKADNQSMDTESVWDKTNIPGFTQVTDRAKISKTRRNIWLILSILGLFLTGYQVQTVVKEYVKFPVKANVIVEETSLQHLPVITVCSYNRIKCSLLERELQICSNNCANLSILCKLGLLSGCSWATFIKNQNSNRTSIYSETCPTETKKLLLSINSPSTIDDEEIGRELDELFGQLMQRDREKIGMNHKAMVKSCKVNLRPCSLFFDIQTINTIHRGNCFTFNQNGTVKTRPGPLEGISLEFYLARDEFIWHYTNSKEGLRVVLHQPDEVPLIEELGMDVMPSTLTSFSLQSKQFKRQPAPYPSKCINSWNNTFVTEDDTYLPMIGRKYTQVGCTRFCLLKHLMRQCQCILDLYDDMDIKEYHQKYNITPLEYCSRRNELQFKCVSLEYNRTNHEQCQCLPSCIETIYEIQTSALTWPSNVGWFYKARTLNVSSILIDYEPITAKTLDYDKSKLSRIQKDIQENLLRLDFYFASMRHTIIEENPVYPDIFSLLTNLGGALSLWMGISFLVVVEILEAFINYVLKVIRGRETK